MKVGRVMGRVVATAKDERLRGKRLLLLQPLDADETPLGDPIVVTDVVGAGAGELVFYVTSYEAAFAFLPDDVITDAAIIGIIDEFSPRQRPPAPQDAAHWPFRTAASPRDAVEVVRS